METVTKNGNYQQLYFSILTTIFTISKMWNQIKKIEEKMTEHPSNLCLIHVVTE